jgi:hypothetical protein
VHTMTVVQLSYAALISCPSHAFKTKAQPISLLGSSPAGVWFDIENNVKIWIEVRCTKVMQLGVLEVFESISRVH